MDMAVFWIRPAAYCSGPVQLSSYYDPIAAGRLWGWVVSIPRVLGMMVVEVGLAPQMVASPSFGDDSLTSDGIIQALSPKHKTRTPQRAAKNLIVPNQQSAILTPKVHPTTTRGYPRLARARSRRFWRGISRSTPLQLISVGYGAEDLKNPNDPEGAENGRVRIVNLTAR